MRQLLPLVLGAMLLAPAPAAASVVTANDLVKLSAAGLSDDILIALIESDGTVFKLTADDVLSLRERGLSQKVILAMLQTARKAAPSPAPPSNAPAREAAAGPPASEGATTVETQPSEPPAPAPPVVVNVTQQVEQRVEQPRERSSDSYYGRYSYVPVAVPIYVTPPVPQKKPEPVYWGFGGQRRPDTWKDRER